MTIERVCRLLLAVAAALAGGAGFAQATLMRAMPIAELAQEADRIVVGTVIAVSSAWDVKHRRILSTVEVEVEESWKGPADSVRRITLVQPGGHVGEVEMTVHGMPVFSVGEKSVLFLRGHLRFQVVGMGQGRRALFWNEPSKLWFAQSPDTEGVVEVGVDAKIRQARRQAPVPLQELHAQVVQALGTPP